MPPCHPAPLLSPRSEGTPTITLIIAAAAALAALALILLTIVYFVYVQPTIRSRPSRPSLGAPIRTLQCASSIHGSSPHGSSPHGSSPHAPSPRAWSAYGWGREWAAQLTFRSELDQPAPVYPTATTSKETHRHHFQSPASLLEAAFPSAAAMPPAMPTSRPTTRPGRPTAARCEAVERNVERTRALATARAGRSQQPSSSPRIPARVHRSAPVEKSEARISDAVSFASGERSDGQVIAHAATPSPPTPHVVYRI